MRSCKLMCWRMSILAIVTWGAASWCSAADGLMVRVKASEGQIKLGSDVLASVPQGTRLWVFDVTDRKWLNVKVPNSEQFGYLDITLVEPVAGSPAEQARVKTAEEIFAQGERFRAKHDPKSAIASFRQCRMMMEQVYGEEHPAVAIVISNLGNQLLDLAQYAEAEQLHRRALAMQGRILGKHHSDTYMSMINLGAVLPKVGQWKEGFELEQQTLESLRQVLGEKHPLTLSAMVNLAVSFVGMGDYEQGHALSDQVLALRREVLGEKHPDTLTSMDHLAVVLRKQGEYTAARRLHEQALALRRETLGEKHPATLDSMLNLALILSDLRDFATAHAMLEQDLAARRELHGPEHPSTLGSMAVLADSFADLEKLDEAQSLYEQALALNQKIRGPNASETLDTMNNLANLLHVKEDYVKARTLHEQVLAIHLKVHGEKHPSTANSLNNLGNVLHQLGDYAAAKSLYERSFSIKRDLLGERHPNTLSALNNLAMIDSRLGDTETAVQMMDELRHATLVYTEKVLPQLSAREQIQFLNNSDGPRLHRGLNFGLRFRDDPLIAMKSAEWLLNAKGIAQQSLSRRLRLARESDDPQLLNNLETLNGLRSQIARMSVKVVPADQSQLHEQQLKDLSEEESRLVRDLGQKGVDVGGEHQWIPINNLRRNIPAGSVVIDLVHLWIYDPEQTQWQPPHYVAWIIEQTEESPVRIVNLGNAATIDRAIRAARKALNEGPEMLTRLGAKDAEERVNEPLRALAEQILDPLLAEVADAKQLILSPDAALWLVPWAALPLEDGRYAVEDYQINYVVSGRDMISQTATGTFETAPVIFADPNFDLTPLDESTPAANRSRGASRFVGSFEDITEAGRLPGTAAEARAITPLLQQYVDSEPVVHLADGAREEVFKQLKQPSLLVLSTHGFFLEDQQVDPEDELATDASRKSAVTSQGQPLENPLLRCGLLLAGCNNRGQASDAVDDGILTGMEIVGTDLRGTKLVVLSACETGIGEVQNGEGVAGLRQAFQLAGAESVLASLWQVPDEQTAMLMEYFFENLATGQGNAEALRNAQLSLMSLLGRHLNTTHPYYWAGFTLTGSYE